MYRFIPTPSRSAVELGPLTIHFYALCILVGVVLALWIGRARYARAGGDVDDLIDVAIFAIPAGIIGGRIYHVATTPELYFGIGRNPMNALKIWDGGMGIWGAIALGTLVSYLAFAHKERSTSFALFADALAPGILVAQAVGRIGNWFNGELFGGPTTLPWGLVIPAHLRPSGYTSVQAFHPTFLYEALWCLICAAAIHWLPRIRVSAPGNIFVAYTFLYCCGRLVIEHLRIDRAHIFLGLRLNEWVSGVGILLATFMYAYRENRAKAVKMHS